MTLAASLSSLIYLLGALLVGGAALVFWRGPQMLTSFGYTPEAHSNIIAGRFIAIAAMTSFMTLAEQWRALAILLGCGALMGLTDMYFVRKVGGPSWPHALAAGICVVLAAGAYLLSPA
jgi:hypothetical protein